MNTPQNTGWIARIFITLATAALLILGFFFMTVALIAGAIVATVIGARLWWRLRTLRRAQSAGRENDNDNATIVDGDYRVIEHESIVVRSPPDSK